MTMLIGLFTTRQAADLSGATQRQLAYWDRTGIYHPAHDKCSVPRPFSRAYDFRDLVALRTLVALRQHVPLQELRRVGDWLREHYDQPWSKLRFFVHAGTVVFADPDSGAVISTRPPGQGILTFDLESIADDVRQRFYELRARRRFQESRVAQNRYITRNEPVLSGTRIPTYFIWDLHQSGRDTTDILRDYPELTEADIETALDFERSTRTSESA